MKKIIKRISISMLVILILIIVYGVVNNSLITENGKFSINLVSENMAPAIPPPPPTNVVAEITKFERDKNDKANLIISTDSFSYEENNLIHTYPYNKIYNKPKPPESLQIIIRDNMSYIESILETGMKLEFETEIYDTKSGYIDLTPQNSTISIISKYDTLIAETSLVTINMKGQHGYIELPNLPSIITIGKIVDCMTKNKDVCHPELHLESIIDNQVKFSSLKRGQTLDISIPGVEKIYLTDSHLYKKYKNDLYSDYMRAEFLTIFSEDYKNSISDNEQLSRNFPYADPYCEIKFNESLDGFDKSCGIRSKIWIILGWFRELLKDDHEGYVVC